VNRDDLCCSCSQCNGVKVRRRAVPPIVNVLLDVAARVSGEVRRHRRRDTQPEALAW
jgi:hypothetical protein